MGELIYWPEYSSIKTSIKYFVFLINHGVFLSSTTTCENPSYTNPSSRRNKIRPQPMSVYDDCSCCTRTRRMAADAVWPWTDSIYLNTSQKRFVGFDDGGITVRRLKPQRLDSFCSFLVACYRDLLALSNTTFCNLLAGKLTMTTVAGRFRFFCHR